MNNPLEQLLLSFQTHPFEMVLAAVAATCTLLFILAVAKSFSEHHAHRSITKEKKTIVTTGTMFLFFFLYLGFLRLNILPLPLSNRGLLSQQIFGAVLLIFATTVNILGRGNLGKQWGDQIRVYDEHTLVQSGWYSVVRHPLYASTIWALLAGTLIYNNGGALLATITIFIPMMHYRASQEEALLCEKFPEYIIYKQKTGRFFPKIIRRKS